MQGLQKLNVVFFRTEAGNEPVRDWLRALPSLDRKAIGDDLRTLQFGWPLGMPLVEKLATGLWEVRTRLDGRIARVIFTVHAEQAVLLHGSSRKVAGSARQTLKRQKHAFAKWQTGNPMRKKHIGSSLEDFLEEDGRLEESTAIAMKRVISWQIHQAMRDAHINKATLARRMNTSRAQLDRLLDESNPSATLDTIARAASALGKRIRLEIA